MPEHDLKADTQTIVQHLSHITRRWIEFDHPCLLEIVYLTAENKADVKHVAHYNTDPDSLALAASDVAAMNRYGINAYATVNPVDANNRPRAGLRAKAENIVGSVFQWADADDAKAAENIKNFVGPKCTFFVLTGTTPSMRPHVYWELDKVTRDMATWEAIQKGIAATLATDSKVTDPPRIMRLAGTINWPKPHKVAKGYVPELTVLKIYNPEERKPVTTEQMARLFSGAARRDAPPVDGAFDVDIGPQSMDRERARIKALSGQEWNSEVFRLVGSYVRKGLSDGEIHGLTDPLTLDGYTVADTRDEVQAMIDRTRSNPKFQEDEPRKAFDFDSGPAAKPGARPTWQIQTAADFTADFVSPEFIIDGVVQRGRLYTLTAPTGSGKTAVMLYAATSLATGTAFCDLEVEHGDVLFMAGENPDDVRARAIATMEFYGIKPDECRIHFVAGTFSIRADMARLKEEAAKLPNLMLVVIDTFAAYFDGDDENSNAQALDFARVVRSLADLPSKPAVIMPAHPVKNASRQNLAPKGGSSLVNEVDGNLTLWNDEGMLTLHWQVKFRGADFEPLKFELQKYQSEKLKDRKGRYVPTILAKPLLITRALQIAIETLTMEDRLLVSIHDNPAMSQAERCTQIGLRLADGGPHKSGMSRLLNRLSEQKLIRKFRSNIELTKDGERAVEMILGGAKFSPDLGA